MNFLNRKTRDHLYCNIEQNLDYVIREEFEDEYKLSSVDSYDACFDSCEILHTQGCCKWNHATKGCYFKKIATENITDIHSNSCGSLGNVLFEESAFIHALI